MREPSGDHASDPSRPRSRTIVCGFPLPSQRGEKNRIATDVGDGVAVGRHRRRAALVDQARRGVAQGNRPDLLRRCSERDAARIGLTAALEHERPAIGAPRDGPDLHADVAGVSGELSRGDTTRWRTAPRPRCCDCPAHRKSTRLARRPVRRRGRMGMAR